MIRLWFSFDRGYCFWPCLVPDFLILAVVAAAVTVVVDIVAGVICCPCLR